VTSHRRDAARHRRNQRIFTAETPRRGENKSKSKPESSEGSADAARRKSLLGKSSLRGTIQHVSSAETPRSPGAGIRKSDGHQKETKVTSASSALSPCLLFFSASLRLRGEKCLRRLPPLTGAPIRIESLPGLHDRRGPVHAGSFLRQRRIAFNCTQAEFPRVFAHELFHFVWLRAGNPLRRSWEALLNAELAAHARGELGWSAAWRKEALATSDRRRRDRRWREYCCESFCDTAAWLYSGVSRHPEFTLAARFRARRRLWFGKTLGNRELPV
jgi:hypothetical protein